MLETKTAITANPAANSAKAASSSCTKYNWAATTAARNHHIHLRLLSSVLVIGLSRSPWVASPVRLRFVSLRCSYCPCKVVCLAPEPLDSFGQAKSMVQKTHFCSQTSLLVPKAPIWVGYHDENKRHVRRDEIENRSAQFRCTSPEILSFRAGGQVYWRLGRSPWM